MRWTAGHCSAGRLSVPSTDLRWDAAEDEGEGTDDGQSGAGGRSRGVVIREGDANARNLARLQLEKYRDAVNVHFAKPETPTNNHGGGSPTRFPELKNQASIRLSLIHI